MIQKIAYSTPKKGLVSYNVLRKCSLVIQTEPRLHVIEQDPSLNFELLAHRIDLSCPHAMDKQNLEQISEFSTILRTVETGCQIST